jgi:L-ascorbate metabolism protein UlaG (beta-lactamase superfamily)
VLKKLYRRVFPLWQPNPAWRPVAPDSPGAALRMRWLGTAGYVIQSATTTVLVDPFFSRPGLGRALQRLSPDEGALDRGLAGVGQVAAVLCSHSHYDHILDAPRVAQRSGARLVGSKTTCAFGRASGLADHQLVEIPAHGATLDVGDLHIKFVPSVHNRLLLGRVLFPGDLASPPRLPARAWEYKVGSVFGLWIETAGTSLYHNGSSDLVDATLEGLRADVLVCGLAGRENTPDYLGRMLRALTPSLVVPTHFDAFFSPVDEGVRLLPGIDLDAFAAEVRERSSAVVITHGFGESVLIPPKDPRGAILCTGP